MAQLITQGNFVGPGERRAARLLRDELPPDWVVICNKEIVRQSGSVREADFIVIGANTVFLVEEKYWRGHLRGNDVGWILPSGESVASPLTQPEGAVRALDGMLRSTLPEVKRLAQEAKAAGGDPHFVFARLFLSHPDVHVEIDDPRADEKLVTSADVSVNLQEFDARFEVSKRARGVSIAEVRSLIIERLTALPDRPRIPERVGDYRILEVTGDVEEGIRSVRARHDDGTDRVLKLIPKPDQLDTQRFAEARTRFLREYESLRRLSDTDCAPTVESYFSWDQGQFWVVPITLPQGVSLAADAATTRPDAPRVRWVVPAIFDAISRVHEADVIHRQLSPDKIWIGPERVWFSDFSVARVVGGQTIAGLVDAEPPSPYRAPECRASLQFATPKSDVFSVAASCIYWLTGSGEVGFDDGTAERILQAVPQVGAIWAREIAALLRDCVAENPDSRPSAAEVAERAARLHESIQDDSSESTHQLLTPQEVLDLWQRTYKHLSEALRREFLARKEVGELVQLNVDVVRSAIRKSRMLDEVLEYARSLALDALRDAWTRYHGPWDEDIHSSHPALPELMSYSKAEIEAAFQRHKDLFEAVHFLRGGASDSASAETPEPPLPSSGQWGLEATATPPTALAPANGAGTPRIVGGRFAVPDKPVHSTAWAEVFKASDLRNQGQTVAVKILKKASDPGVVRVLFERERTSLGALDHPHIVRLLDTGREDNSGDYYLALEWIPRSLADHIDATGPLGWDDFAEMFALPLLRALAFAHEQGVVHRDVKPNNVLITADGQPKLADFGISKVKTQLARDAGTVADFFTPPFCPPDLESVSSTNRDVFGFGVLMLAAVSEAPVEEYWHFDRALQEANVVDEVRKLIGRCISLAPEDRPENAVVLLAELEAIQRPRSARWSVKDSVHLQAHDSVLAKFVRELRLSSKEEARRVLSEELAGTLYAEVDQSGRSFRVYSASWRFVLQEIAVNSPYLLLHKAYKAGPGEQDAARDRSLQLSYRLTLEHPLDFQKAVSARQAFVEAIVDHEDSRHENRVAREEQRIFDQWANQLAARERAEERKAPPLRFSDARLSGRRVYLTLEHEPLEDHVGEPRMIESEGSGRRVLFAGEVEAVSGTRLTLYLRRPARAEPPKSGKLVLDIHATRQAIRRQREALRVVRNPDRPGALRADLGELVVHPERSRAPVDVSVSTWFTNNLDEDKKVSVSRALGNQDFLVVQGPPGTGKTTLIAELIAQEWRRNPQVRVLLTSQTHIAVDNALERLREMNCGFRMVRVGDSAGPLADRIADLSMDHQLEDWRAAVRARSEDFIRRWATEQGVDLSVVRRLVLIRRLREVTENLATCALGLSEAEQLLEESSSSGKPLTDSERLALHDRRTELRAERTRLRRDAAALAEELSPLIGETAAVIQRKRPQDLNDLLPASASTTPTEVQDLVDVQERWLLKLGRGPEFEEALLYASNVIGGTCIGIAGIRALENIEFDLCILDEASKATATESLVPFVRGRRWIMVGDQAQLPPFQDDALRDPDLQKEFDLDEIELKRTLFDRLSAGLPPANQVWLTSQHRMVQPIGDLISNCFYQGRLVSARPASPEAFGLLMERPVMWLDTGRSPERGEKEQRRGPEMSFHNPLETRAIDAALTKLHGRMKWLSNQRNGMEKASVLVLSGYRAQVAQITDRLDAKRREIGDLLDVEVNTVDAAQGREADILVFSVTRSNQAGRLGFLTSEARINVALSRGKSFLVIVGDLGFCATHAGPLRRVAEYIREHPDDCAVEVVGK